MKRYFPRIPAEGPDYPDMPRLNYWRWLAKQRPLTEGEKMMYGAAVLKEIGLLNRAQASKGLGLGLPKARCASGTYANNAKDIFKAITAVNAAAIDKANRDWQTRRVKDGKMEYEYKQIMAAKRGLTNT